MQNRTDTTKSDMDERKILVEQKRGSTETMAGKFSGSKLEGHCLHNRCNCDKMIIILRRR